MTMFGAMRVIMMLPVVYGFGCGTLTCTGTTAGKDNTAIGYKTAATGPQGDTAMGFHTSASGGFSTAMGYACEAKQLYATAMGASVEATESESLVVSGNVHAKNVHASADRRLVANVQPLDPSSLLQNIMQLKAVSHRPSPNYCRHLNRTEAQCLATPRAVGLLADDVKRVVPEAVASGSSLHLRHDMGNGGAMVGDTIEYVDGVQGINLHAMIAQLVGGMQAQQGQIAALEKQNKVLMRQLGQLRAQK